jgi:transmembrane secretion effector
MPKIESHDGTGLYYEEAGAGTPVVFVHEFAGDYRKRYARHNRHLRGTLMRVVGFFLFASAYWVLLPLVAREQIAGGPGVYGVLLGFIGAGAVGGAFFLPWLKSKLGPDRLMALGALGQALAMVLYGIARDPAIAVVASLIAGGHRGLRHWRR